MTEETKQKSRECAKCRSRFEAGRRICPNCGLEFREDDGKFRPPVIIYPLLIMFGIYIVWELLTGFFRSP